MSPPTLLVTGANGFVGSTILDALAGLGREAVGLVRPGREGAGRPGIAWRTVPSWSSDHLAAALTGVSAVIHSATIVHRPGAAEDEYVRFNGEGTRALVEACRASGVARLVLLSTIKVYGEAPVGVIDESTRVAPEGPYATTKLEAERIVLAAAREGGPDGVVLRLSPVFGRGDKGNVRTMIRAIARRRFLLPGDGATRKSIVHAPIVASAAIAAADTRVPGVFVVADREAPTMRELADSIARALGRPRPMGLPVPFLRAAAAGFEVVFGALGRPAPVTRDLIRKSLVPTICSPARVEAELGVKCHADLDPAIDDEVRWMRAQGIL